jgi:hypothetical protein
MKEIIDITRKTWGRYAFCNKGNAVILPLSQIKKGEYSKVRYSELGEREKENSHVTFIIVHCYYCYIFLLLALISYV